MSRILTPQQKIERSIVTDFRRDIWNKFVMGYERYDMIKPGDKIAVCISGGKDSMLLAKCMQHLQKYQGMDIGLEFIVMNPGYSDANRQRIIDNAALMGIPIKMFETKVFDIAYNTKRNPCYLCARMRRGWLYKFAQDLGCNKIALGHHFDDVIETILMGMLYSGKVETMMPKLHSQNFEGMELIRPLYLVKEEDIKAWRDYNRLQFIQCACRFTENCTSCGGAKGSKREEMKDLVTELRKKSEFIDSNIFNSVSNVNLKTIIGYKKDGEYHNFLDNYDAE